MSAPLKDGSQETVADAAKTKKKGGGRSKREASPVSRNRMSDQRSLIGHPDRCGVRVDALLFGCRQNPFHSAGYGVRIAAIKVLLEHWVAGKVAVNLLTRVA